MKLTPKEQEICDKYSAYDETGHVQYGTDRHIESDFKKGARE